MKEEVEEEAAEPAPVADEASEEEEEDKMVIKSAPKPGDAVANPTGTTEVFMGNLSYNIDDDGIKEVSGATLTPILTLARALALALALALVLALTLTWF